MKGILAVQCDFLKKKKADVTYVYFASYILNLFFWFAHSLFWLIAFFTSKIWVPSYIAYYYNSNFALVSNCKLMLKEQQQQKQQSHLYFPYFSLVVSFLKIKSLWLISWAISICACFQNFFSEFFFNFQFSPNSFFFFCPLFISQLLFPHILPFLLHLFLFLYIFVDRYNLLCSFITELSWSSMPSLLKLCGTDCPRLREHLGEKLGVTHSYRCERWWVMTSCRSIPLLGHHDSMKRNSWDLYHVNFFFLQV